MILSETGEQTTLLLGSTAPGDTRGQVGRAGLLDWVSPSTAIALDSAAFPFAGDVFDQVVGRHLSRSVVSLDRLLSEIARVLKPGGRLLLSDYLAPDKRKGGENKDARWLNAFFGLRDLAPAGFVSRSVWNTLFYQAGFQLDGESFSHERIDFGEWAVRTHPSSVNVIRLQAMLVQAPEPLKAFLTVEMGADRIAFSMVVAHFRARKRDSHAP
jgi:SAM-dependent methyltransferase